jgi:molecular chaperone GrpE
MPTDTEKSELLEDFQKYLQQNELESYKDSEQPDLNSLLSEMAELKTEVKAESRQFKHTLDTLSSALATVEDDNKTLASELAEKTQQLETQHIKIIRAMLLDIIDIYDRFALGRDVLVNYQPVNSLFKSSRKKDINFINRFKQGHDMTLNRLEQILQRYQVSSIKSVGEIFDPETMHVVETDCLPGLENGRVIEELRQGFLYQDQVLRLAEVKVNKLT